MKNKLNFKFLSIFALLLVAIFGSNRALAEGDTVWTKYIGSTVRTVKFSPEGRFVYAAAEGRGPLKLDANTGEILTEYKGFTYSDYLFYNALDISPDGKTLVGGDFHKLYFYDSESGKLIDSLESSTMNFEYNRFNDVLFTKDNQYVIACLDYAPSAENTSSKLIIWDKITKKIIKEFFGNKILKIAQTESTSILAYMDRDNSDNSYFINLLEIGTWKELGVLEGHQNRITDLSFSPDGSLLASCDEKSFINIWAVENQELKNNFKFEGLGMYALDFFQNDKIALGGGTFDDWKFSSKNLNNMIEYQKYNIRVKNIDYNETIGFVLAESRTILIVKKDKLSSIPFNISKDKIFPNPTNQNLTIPKSYFNDNFIYFNIIDLTGKEVYRFNKNTNFDLNEDLIVDVSRYNKGSYIVQFFYDNNSMPLGVKFIKDF